MEKLEVLSQGPHHLAVFKPHGIAVVGGRGVERPTLLDLVRERFGKNVFAVHRLDRVTSGITIFARSIFAKHAIENAFKKRLVKKTYLALCEGQPGFTRMTIDKRLKKIDLKSKKKGPVAKQIVDSSGKQASTKVRLIKQIDDQHCLIEAEPISGRMHQIRVHLSHVGLPILGDRLYGSSSRLPPHRIALCAVKILLPLPKGQALSIDISDRFTIADYLDRATLSCTDR